MENTRELFRGNYDFEIKDQLCLYESGFWAETLERWWGEGLSQQIPAAPFWGVDESGTDVNQHLNALRPVFLPVEPWPKPSNAGKIAEDEQAGVTVLKNEWGATANHRLPRSQPCRLGGRQGRADRARGGTIAGKLAGNCGAHS